LLIGWLWLLVDDDVVGDVQVFVLDAGEWRKRPNFALLANA